MKIRIALLLALLALLAGCSFPAKAETNEIRPAELSEREQSLVALIGAADLEILLFEYDVSEPCVWFEVWVEIYEKGELVTDELTRFAISDPGVLSSGGEQVPQPFKGRLAVTVDSSGSETLWRVSTDTDEGSRVSGVGQAWPRPEYGASARGKISEAVPVEIGKEIILASAVYSSGTVMQAYDITQYTDPEYIKQQEYLELIKCKFS